MKYDINEAMKACEGIEKIEARDDSNKVRNY